MTNNEVANDEAEVLYKQGYQPGDPEWEKYGIARYITWPRTICSINGHDINGNQIKGEYLGENIPIADGFATNAAFYKLSFLDPNAVSLGFCGKELLPVLWMKAGMKGQCPIVEGELPDGMEILTEVLERSKITDKKRLSEIIAEIYSGLRSDLPGSGHTTAALRAKSYISPLYCLKEKIEGVDYYRFISGLNDDFEAAYDELAAKLEALQKKLLSRDRVKLSYTNKGLPSDETKSAISTFLNTLSDEKMGEKAADPVPEKKNEGFTTAGQVQFVATAWDFKNKELPFTGALHVLQIIFSYDYLWINVRVKGGAYGAMCDFGREGVGVFTSYRDPNLGKTYDIYRNACDYVREFDCSDRDMLKYIIGTISKADMPLTPSAEGIACFYAWLMGRTDEDRQKTRDEILATDQAAIRALVPYLEGAEKTDSICVVGAKGKVEEEKELFTTIESLL